MWNLLREFFEKDWFWAFINIVLPIGLPIGGMMLSRISMPKSVDKVERARILRTRPYILLFKDGQLGWVALLMCMTGFSEFGDGIKRGHPAPNWMIPFFVVIVLVALASGILATNGAVDTVEVKDTKTFRNWFGYYSVAVWTIILAVLAAVAFSTAHFWAE